MNRILAVITLLATAVPAVAQQSTNTIAPTQPGKGQWVYRPVVSHYEFKSSDDDPRSGSQTWWTNHISYGLSGDMSLMFHFSEIWDNLGDEDHSGLGDGVLTFKWRCFQLDTGPVDSLRIGIFGGLELPTGSDAFSSDETSPFIGASIMSIQGRHGIGQSVSFLATQGRRFDPVLAGDTTANLLKFDTAYLYRLYPDTYGDTLEGAWYAGCEFNGRWESNSDLLLMLSPTLLYEAPYWAAELSVGIPVYERVTDRPKLEVVVRVGVRLLF